MVKKMIIFAFVFFCLTGCFYTRTDYGNIRFKSSRFTIKPNSNYEVYKIIDTTKLYELVSVIDTLHNQKFNFKKEYIKFYANGKAGKFDFYNEGILKSLDPKRARMAYYNFDGKNFKIQFYFENAQGGNLSTDKLFKRNENNLIFIGETTISNYQINYLPSEFLIYKPDW